MPRRHTASGVKPSIGSPANVIAAFVRRHRAGDHVEQRRLAGAVRADHGEDHALRHVEADGVDGDEAAETLADAARPRAAASSAALRDAEPARQPRPHAFRQRHDHEQQTNAVEDLLGAGQIEAER